MTVKELIDKLKDCNPELPVIITADCHNYDEISIFHYDDEIILEFWTE